MNVASGVNVTSPVAASRVKVPFPATTTELAVQLGAVSPEPQSFSVDADRDVLESAESLVRTFVVTAVLYGVVVESFVDVGGGTTTREIVDVDCCPEASSIRYATGVASPVNAGNGLKVMVPSPLTV